MNESEDRVDHSSRQLHWRKLAAVYPAYPCHRNRRMGKPAHPVDGRIHNPDHEHLLMRSLTLISRSCGPLAHSPKGRIVLGHVNR
jgi:hypothetical protein